jgi:hypothetical protein
MIKWTEGRVHLAMRKSLRSHGFTLVAGEYPGGSDHELYPLNVTDPTVARDNSPDPRRHSAGELIPDIVALKDRFLVIGEAKVHFNEPDRSKLAHLIEERHDHFRQALERFAVERKRLELLPFASLKLFPTLIFTDQRAAPNPSEGFSHLVIGPDGSPKFVGAIEECLL